VDPREGTMDLFESSERDPPTIKREERQPESADSRTAASTSIEMCEMDIHPLLR